MSRSLFTVSTLLPLIADNEEHVDSHPSSVLTLTSAVKNISKTILFFSIKITLEKHYTILIAR